MTKKNYFVTGFAFLFLTLAGGCSDGSGSSSGPSGSTTVGQTGVTACGSVAGQPSSCQAGQYCADETFSRCVNGCLSNANCASDQECKKAGGENDGTCQNKTSAPPTGVDCAAFCDKATACGVTSTTSCDQVCKAVSSACRACVVDANCNDPNACSTECNTGSTPPPALPDNMGAKCSTSGVKCANNLSCIAFAGGLDGICTKQCATFAECPTFWDCNAKNGGKFCQP